MKILCSECGKETKARKGPKDSHVLPKGWVGIGKAIYCSDCPKPITNIEELKKEHKKIVDEIKERFGRKYL